MFTRNNKLYADAFKYLRNEKMNAVALMVNNPEGWQEISFPEDFTVQVEERHDEKGNVIGYDAFFHGRLFLIQLDSTDYNSVKSAVIRRRYSLEEQTAIILNKDKNEEKLKEYADMQAWRDFAALLASKISSVI
ncbi:MAG: hypothetical protein J1E16_05690 [Muribaculaceae bacterium]|nr:hypothetical protein [Muribaculaceae bacterium]